MRYDFQRFIKTTAATTFCVAVLLTAAAFLFPQKWLLPCAITFGTTAYHFIMRLAVGSIVPKVTGYAFDYRSRWFQPRSWEPALYRFLKLKQWKGKLPTYAPDQFSLENQSLHQVILNMCGAEIVHEGIMLLSFLPVLMIPVFGSAPVFVITSALSALFDSLFVMAQRFNRPRLVRIYERQEAKRL